MNKKFIKENSKCFSSDLNAIDNLIVIKHIMKIPTISYIDQVSIIKQFLNNWLNVEVVSCKK
jgi:hypothetical protein